MKIAVIFDQSPQRGGTFHQAVSALTQIKKICGSAFDIAIYHLHPGEDAHLTEVALSSHLLPRTMRSRIVEDALNAFPRLSNSRLRLISPRERYLISQGVDLVYFTSSNPFAVSLKSLNYILTVQDICYRDFPEFPDTVYAARESYNQRTLARAVLVIADSEKLKRELIRIYGLSDERVLAMPFAVPQQFQSAQIRNEHVSAEKYGLKNGYLFYPAQFWAHKNHVRIVQAINILKKKGRRVHAAFAGGDRGGQQHVAAIAAKLDVVGEVHFLGFVPTEDLPALYRNSLALVMPTYFGPTNIPPLEAWSLDVPVIYSQHLSGGIEDGVLSVDPDSPESIAEAIERVMQDDIRRSLISGGRQCLARIQAELAASEDAFRNHLLRFAKRRELWR